MSDLKLGSLIGERYTVVKQLGSGVGSTVYLAYDLQSEGAQVALKVVGGNERDEVLREFFERETEILRRIRHPNIIRLLDFGTTGGVGSWLVLEFAPGGSLADAAAQQRLRAADDLTRLLADCCGALLHAHLAGVVHRDLKPSNILFDAERAPRIVDFNVSKLSGRATSLNTLRHYITLRYASPEQRAGRVADEKTDIYSLGLIAAELMLGRPIEEPATAAQAVETTSYGGPLRRIVRRFLAETPAERPGAAEALQELKELAASTRILEKLYFRMSHSAVRKIAEVQGPGTNEIEVVRLVEEDLRGPLLVDSERQTGNAGELTYVFRGQRFSYFVIPIDDSTTQQSLLLRGVSLLRPEHRGQRRAEAAELEACAVVTGPRGEHPRNRSAAVLADMFGRVEMDRSASVSFDRQRESLLSRWSTYLEVAKEVQAGRERLGEVVASTFLPDRDMYRFEIRGVTDDDALLDHPVCYVANDGRVTPVGTVADHVGAALLVRPHDDLPGERRFPIGGSLQLDVRREQVSVDRQSHALRAVRNNAGARSDLAELLVRPDRVEPATRRIIQPLHERLDETNRRVVEQALGTASVFMIQGPPGTGKTTVISELIGQILQREPGSRILIASQSNVAVDNVLERLLGLIPSLEAVRLGRSEKISDEAQQFELTKQLTVLAGRMRAQAARARDRLARLRHTPPQDIQVLASELREAVVSGRHHDIEAVAVLARETFGPDAPNDPEQLAAYLDASAHIVGGSVPVDDVVHLQADWIERTKGVDEFQQQLLTEARVIAGTCLGFASSKIAAELTYDWVIIDEAGRASPPEVLVPMVRGRRFVLVGDHKQLPPILDDAVASRVVDRLGIDKELLECSLFQDMFEGVPEKARMRLVRQYRMHPVIGDLISQVFYSGELQHGIAPADRSLGTRLLGAPLRWIDTSQHANARESRSGTSFSNRLEVELIAADLRRLARAAREAGESPRVGILTAYAAQVELLETQLFSRDAHYAGLAWSVLTVDAAQGKEFEFVYYSAVRSNPQGKIGFLRDVRRLNVALSRARECLTVVGNREALAGTSVPGSGNPFPAILQHLRLTPADSPIIAA